MVSGRRMIAGRLRAIGHACAVAIVLLACALPARAADVAVLMSRADGPERVIADALTGAPGRHRVFLAGNTEDGVSAAALAEASLVIALGARAAQSALALDGRPVLVALVTHGEFERLRTASPSGAMTALLLDQPAQRHLRLIRAILPQAACTGLILGPESRHAETRFEPAAARAGLPVASHFAADARDVLPAIERLLGRCHAVLTLPDAVVSNPTVARAALLTSYRMQRPLFAYSRAWVDAGALAAVFSTPATVTRDLLDWLDGLGDPRQLPAVQQARHFDFAVNARVARALNLTVPDEDTLRTAIAAGREP